MDRTSLTAHNSKDDIKPIVDERIGQFLSSTPPVAEQILCHLVARDLNSCARVCKLWSKIAEAVKKRRRDILWMFQGTLCSGEDLGLLTGGRDDEHCTEDMIYMTAADEPSGVGDHFFRMIDSSLSQPQWGVIFCSTGILIKPSQYFNTFCGGDDDDDNSDTMSAEQDFYYHEPFMQYLRKELPANCRIICCGAPGIVGTPVDNSVPAEMKLLTGFSACMLPNLPGLDVHPFSIPEDLGRTLPKRKKFDEGEIAQFTGVPENVNVKALIVFCEEVPDRGGIMRAIVHHYLEKQELKIALGGAIVDTVVAPMKNKDAWPMVAGLFFMGETLKAASMIIQPHVQTVEELEKDLIDFKNSVTLGTRSIAFMFACCGKGCSYYEEPNVEPKAFRKVFPDTLLFGCFSNGEIGITYLPNAQPPREKLFTFESKPKKIPKWVHGYTTIFVLLSW